MAGAAVTIQGKPTPKNLWEMPLTTHTAVTSGYCRTFGIPIIKGRDLNSNDDSEHAPAVLVNQAFVKTFLPGENPIGRRISYRSDSVDWHEIVGVVGDARQQEIEKAIAPQIFIPLYRSVDHWLALAARTGGDPLRYSQALQEQIHKVDPEAPIFRTLTIEQIMGEELGFRAFHTSLLAVFAGVALTLSAIGIYAVLAYSVTQRTAEIGLRMACGADSKAVLRMIVRQGITPALIGAVAGAVCAVRVAKLLSQLLFEVKFTNWTAYFAALAFLIAVAAAACYFPARRAASVDPLKALHNE
jgi:putative ABC transport system permease protein